MSPAAQAFAPGARVRVRDDWPETRGPCHIRTPHYVRGRAGTLVRHLGDFPDPEALAFARPARRLALFHVAIPRAGLWPDPAAPGDDDILLEVYETWLEPA